MQWDLNVLVHDLYRLGWGKSFGKLILFIAVEVNIKVGHASVR